MKQVRLPSKKVVVRYLKITLVAGVFYFLLFPLAFGSYPHQVIRQAIHMNRLKPELEWQQTLWDNHAIDHYQITIKDEGFYRHSMVLYACGPATIEVQNTSIVNIDIDVEGENTNNFCQRFYSEDRYTLEGLFDEVRFILGDSPIVVYYVEPTYDPDYGFVTSLNVSAWRNGLLLGLVYYRYPFDSTAPSSYHIEVSNFKILD